MYWNKSEGDLTWIRYFSCDSVNEFHLVIFPSSPMVEVTVGRPRLRERDFITSLVLPPKVKSRTRSGPSPSLIIPFKMSSNAYAVSTTWSYVCQIKEAGKFFLAIYSNILRIVCHQTTSPILSTLALEEFILRHRIQKYIPDQLKVVLFYAWYSCI